MLESRKQNQSPFAHKVRVRVCGILKEDKKVLLLKHRGIGQMGYLWSPPGGGVEFGQSLSETLKREFLEETNIAVTIKNHLYTNEHIDDRHHAIEFFFSVERISGQLRLGHDPELSSEEQILMEARFFSSEDLQSMPREALHRTLQGAKSVDRIDDLRGLITFED